MSYAISESDARGLRSMYRWWRSFTGGGGVPRRGQILGSSVVSLKLTSAFTLGVAGQVAQYVPRASAVPIHTSTDTTPVTVYLVNSPITVSAAQLAALNAAWYPNLDVLLAARWHDGFGILSPIPHILRLATYSTSDYKITFGTSTVKHDVLIPYLQSGSVAAGDLHVLFDTGTFSWRAIAAAPVIEVD